MKRPLQSASNQPVGTGTILEVLRLARPLIVVPNPSLLHNHQQELGLALHRLGHLKCADLRSVDV